jgi:hypothetical protein
MIMQTMTIGLLLSPSELSANFFKGNDLGTRGDE